jgi:hypothetical protein
MTEADLAELPAAGASAMMHHGQCIIITHVPNQTLLYAIPSLQGTICHYINCVCMQGFYSMSSLRITLTRVVAVTSRRHALCPCQAVSDANRASSDKHCQACWCFHCSHATHGFSRTLMACNCERLPPSATLLPVAATILYLYGAPLL